MKWMWKHLVLLGGLGLTAGGAVGCATERAPINRVQADALAKSFFVGDDLASSQDDPEFYMRTTVIDVGYGAGQDGLFTSTYAQPVSRIRWQITSDQLIARLSYERIADSDGKGTNPSYKMTEDGQVVAAYKIESHFDIRRDYNPSTGEEQNVIVENSTDRPWNERQYFRVDWSTNLVTDQYDFDTLSMLGVIGGIEYEPLAYTVLDPADPNAPHFEADEGYFDVTNKAFAKPAVIDLSSLGWGIDSYPACFLPGEFAGGTNPYGNCGPMEVTLRQSFKRVVDKDYQPMDYDGYRFQAFGVFTTDRMGYDRNYGVVDSKWHRFASRYNIWDRSHYYDSAEAMSGPINCNVPVNDGTDPNGGPNPFGDPNFDGDKDGTADVCLKAGPGSQCDTITGKCTLPYELRKAVTIPWYINGIGVDPATGLQVDVSDPAALAAAKEKADDLFEATNWAVQEWDLAMKSAIMTARYAECVSTNAANCAATCGAGNCDASICGNQELDVKTKCQNMFPNWVGQQEDIDEAIMVARDLDKCQRASGYGKCASTIQNAVAQIASERGNPNDFSAFAIGRVSSMEPVIVLCHNPVIAGDHPSCGPEGLAPRVGDIRYNNVLNIDKPQQPSAWGIMVDADDPLTGEKVAASINIWTHVTDIASINLVDLVKYINGEISTEDITDGSYINNWVQAQKLNGGMNRIPTMSRHEHDSRIAAAGSVSVDRLKELRKQQLPETVKRGIAQTVNPKVHDAAMSPYLPSQSAATAWNRMQLARGTEIESKLMNKPMMELAGLDGNSPAPTSGSAADAISPLAMANPKVRFDFHMMKQNALADHGACVIDEAPEPSSLTAIASVMGQKFPAADGETIEGKVDRWTRMQRYIRRKYHYAVLAHEMGHSVGLRHNFISTAAALHFRPQYWQLRTKDGSVQQPCTDSNQDPETCVGPRYFDTITPAENDQMIWMFQQSTVMDYPGDVSQDTIGLGTYDFAAARMFYGDVVSVYDVGGGQMPFNAPGHNPNDYLAGGNVGIALPGVTDNFGGLLGVSYSINVPDQGTDEATRCIFGSPCAMHYSQLQHYYALIHDCFPAQVNADPNKPPAWYDTNKDGYYNVVFDGHIVSPQGSPTKCRTLPVDYTFWNKLRTPTATEAGGGYVRGINSVEDGTGRQRVPYSFASDNWADTGNVSVFRHDNGADPYEQIQFLINTQEDRHIFDNYRRGRTTFNVRAAADRSFERYNQKMAGIANGVGFLSNVYKNFSAGQGITYDSLWPLIADAQMPGNIVAASVAFDHFTRELGRPESGAHYQLGALFNDPTLRSASDSDGNPGTTVLAVPNGTAGYFQDVSFGGHPLENLLADDKGDYDAEYAVGAGAYYDKINSAILLSQSEDQFISEARQDFYDARFRAVGMADVFPDGYRRTLGAALTGDRSILAPQVSAHVNTMGKLVPDTASDPRDPTATQYPATPLAWPSMWPPEGPIRCFPSKGTNVCQGYTGSTDAGGFHNLTPGKQLGVDPQIGWEVQKFIIAWTLAYIPADEQSNWLDMMRLYRIGQNADPAFESRIEWQDPQSGEIFYAHTYGKECLFATTATAPTSRTACETANGKWVEKGIAARVLQYANQLTAAGYILDTAGHMETPEYPAGFNEYGRAMVVYQLDGSPAVAADPALTDANGGHVMDCNQNDDPTCTPLSVYSNHNAYALMGYKEVPNFLWEVVIKYGLGTPDERGVYPE